MSSVVTRPIPEYSGPPGTLGPLTRAKLKRLLFLYIGLCVIGFGFAFIAQSPNWQAFGLGLVYPGGGFIHFATGGGWSIFLHVLCTVASVVLFVVSMFVWFATGNQAAPFIVWLGTALAAAAMGHPHTVAASPLIVTFIALGSIGGSLIIHHRNVQRKLERRAAREPVRGTWPQIDTVTDTSTRPVVEELSRDAIDALRYALDRALQPVDEFNGFDFIDQFQPSAVRYQINNLSYALSLANAIRLPAFHAYLHQGQSNLIRKKMQHRVWKYWALESLWGNFRRDPNPISRDNIMYSGWYAAQIGLYEAVTGDSHYSTPGSITLTAEDGSEYVNDYHSIVKTLTTNQRNSEFCLFPCEPNFIYPLCNNQAAIGVRLHDRLHGTAHWSAIKAEYRQRLEQEFFDIDGHLVLFRSNRTGLTIPGLSSSSEDAIAAYWMHPLFPDLSCRLWEIARHELFESRNGELTLLPLKPWLDAGNYRFNTAYALGALGMTAVELGDTEAAAAIMRHVDSLPTNRSDGVLSYPGCSTWSHAFLLSMRLGRTNGLADTINTDFPNAWRNGPVISAAPYPQVLPARAVSDGETLEATLYPGAQGGEYDLTVSRLQPDTNYQLSGTLDDTGRSDRNGDLDVRVRIDDRKEIRIAPAAS